MKRRTKRQKFNDIADAYDCVKKGKKVKRLRAKDDSIATHPIVPCIHHPEKTVLKHCLEWLRVRHIICWRHDSGTFQNSRGQWGTYGIKGAGDIIGIISIGRPGVYFEIECKKGSGGRLALNQQKHKKQVEDAGGIYLIVHGIEELKYYFKNYLDKAV